MKFQSIDSYLVVNNNKRFFYKSFVRTMIKSLNNFMKFLITNSVDIVKMTCVSYLDSIC